MENLRKKTVSGVKWMIVASVAQKIISFGVTIILARILGPSEFGLFALALVIVGSFELFKSLGVDSALIQRKDNVEVAANTVFLIIPVLAIFLYVLLFFFSPFVASFLRTNELAPIVRALGLVFVISCFARVPAILMEKNLQFNKISLIEVSTSLIFSLVALVCALCGLKVWSLVFAYLIKIIFYTILFWRSAAWVPKFKFDMKIAVELILFGRFLFLGGVVWFLKTNLDNFLVGRLLGVSMLGLYAVAFNISNFCSDYLGSQIYRVIVPSFSKLQDDVITLRRAILKILKYVALFAIPFATGAYLLGDDFLRFAYGEKWIGAGSVLKILVWAGMFNLLPVSFVPAFIAIGKPRLQFLTTLLQVVLFFIFIAPMSRLMGLDGVGFVVLFSNFSAFIFGIVMTNKLFNITFIQMLNSLKPALLISSIMAIGIVLLKLLIIHNRFSLSVVNNFGLLFITAVIVYFAAIIFLERSLIKEVKEMLV